MMEISSDSTQGLFFSIVPVTSENELQLSANISRAADTGRFSEFFFPRPILQTSKQTSGLQPRN